MQRTPGVLDLGMHMSESTIGIGAQVWVRDASESDRSPWPGEPSGIVFRSGGSALSGVWGSGGGVRLWWIEFDRPQMRSDGEGPYRSAQVHEKYLELAPPVEGFDED